MGSGFHDFAPAEVLTAANVDGYLMRQTLMTFASEAARNSALSGVLDEGMITYQEDSNRITYYTGAAWVILSEPAQSWAGFAGTQGVSLTFSATSGWYQRKNGAFTAQMTATLSNSGTAANTIVATLPITLSTTEAVGDNDVSGLCDAVVDYDGGVFAGGCDGGDRCWQQPGGATRLR
jgi:hypothetical protein